jgi:hypothetical protein
VRRRDYGALRVPMLAGWLFADLFIVLFIVAFSSQLSVPVTPRSTPTPTVSKSPAPIRQHKPTGLEQNPVNIRVYVSPTAVDDPGTHARAVAALLSSLRKKLAARHLLGEKSGFVLIFASSVPGASDPINEAIRVAKSIKPILKKRDAATFGKTSSEGLWGGSGESFYFQIFFFT